MQAQALLELRRRRKGEPLYDFVPRTVRGYTAPRHLAPLVAEFERSWTERVRCAAHAPPRHSKTETVLLFLALTLQRFPHKSLGYITYEANLARSKSRKVRAWAQQAGVQLLDGARRMDEWVTKAGGGLIAGGIGGPLTGRGLDLLVIDDPYKNRAQAESAAYQRMVIDWWGDVANTRIEPGGSIFVFHTRWTTNDLIGHILGGEDAAEWRWLRMAALQDEPGQGRPLNTALWPERWPEDELLAKQRAVGPYTWASLYQGRPQPRGGAVFGEPRFYDTLPAGYRVGIGVDLAYTKATKSDHSAAVVLAEKDNVFYVLDVVRTQGLSAPQFAERLKHLKATYPGAPFRWIASGTEVGSADFIKAAGIPLTVENASTDKFVRAIDVAAAWNSGRLLLPSDPRKWVPVLLDEVSVFTGQNDPEDDQVDALAAAHRIVSKPAIDTSLHHVRPRRLWPPSDARSQSLRLKRGPRRSPWCARTGYGPWIRSA